ncbi:asparagine synthase (glutamine-hydrolyzing) [Aliihoeflea sp. PC F10.4]
MCGIAGGIWAEEVNRIDDKVNSALAAMRHRGPNDSGVEIFTVSTSTVALAQTRLSVIDLSSGGHQPMWSDNGKYAIVFNGEIYNYKELRAELADCGHIFRTASDTEVLLKAWVHWGESCLMRCEGMFAFAIADVDAGTVTCVRDAFGIKPFFYDSTNGFVFASEQPALLSMRTQPPKANLQRAYDYLVNGDYDNGPNSFVDGVRHLEPGHIVEVDIISGRIKSARRWWWPKFAERPNINFGEAAEMVRDAFLHNVKLHLRSDVPLGAALSGGIDSSAIVCAMRHVAPDAPIHTFSYVASGAGLSEESWIDSINEHVGAVSHKVTATANDFARDVDAMILAQGEPFGSTSIYAQYRVFQLARESGMTVTLEGQGADELLAGYWGYPGYRIRSLVESKEFARAHRFAKHWSTWPGRSYHRAIMYYAATVLRGRMHARGRALLGRDARPKWLDVAALTDAGVQFEERLWSGAPHGHGRRVVERLAYEAQERVLPSLLRHSDRNAMRFSIEGRVPFLTPQFAELLLSLPESFLISDGGETKSVFREAMRGIVPSAILDRKDKIGFATPEREWLLSIAPQVRGWLRESGEVPFLRQQQLLEAFDDVVVGRRSFSWQVWRWINYVRWYRLAGMQS